MPDTWGQEKKLQSKMLILNLFGALSKIFRDALSFGRAYWVLNGESFVSGRYVPD